MLESWQVAERGRAEALALEHSGSIQVVTPLPKGKPPLLGVRLAKV